MKPWITISLAFCAVTLGLASWLEATTQSYETLPALPPVVEKEPQFSEPLKEVIHTTRKAHRALAEIKVIDTTPEQLRASFTKFWSLCIEIDTDSLTEAEAATIRKTLHEAHIKRTAELTAELKHLPLTRESNHLMNELVRGIRATSKL